MRQLGQAYAEKLMCSELLSSRAKKTQDLRYRSTLGEHLSDTRGHARRLKDRLEQLGEDTTAEEISVRVALFADSLVKQPLEALYPETTSEKLLRSAREQCAIEAREVATFYVLESIAAELGDTETARLCSDVRSCDERAFLGHLHETIPALVAAMVRKAQPNGEGLRESGVAKAAAWFVRQSLTQGLRLGRKLSSAPRGQRDGGGRQTADQAIAGYDSLRAELVIRELPGLSQRELDEVDTYERAHKQRRSILKRIRSLRSPEPWPGYDELTVAEIGLVLADSDREHLTAVRDYERCHKARRRVLEWAEHQLVVSPNGD